MAARALSRIPGLAGPQPSHHTFFAERTHFARGSSLYRAGGGVQRRADGLP
jgi:hypothetical protein